MSMIPITIVDDFADEPHQLVEVAKQLEFTPDPNGMYPGVRSKALHEVSPYLYDIIITKIMGLFQAIPDLGRSQISYGPSAVESVDCNMFFQKIPAKMNRGWIHCDDVLATGILYLNDGDGTSIYNTKKGKVFDVSHRETKRKCNLQGYMTEEDTIVQTEFNDLFEEHVNVKGKSNRLLLIPNCYHGANNFEVDGEERLTLVMFFHRIAGEPMPIERMRTVRTL